VLGDSYNYDSTLIQLHLTAIQLLINGH